MSSSQDSTVQGALTGLVVAAAVGWQRSDDATQRSIAQNRHATRDLQHDLRDIETHGSFVRAHLPVVMDCEVGLALASQSTPSPEYVPTSAAIARPNLADGMEAEVNDFHWPPRPGVYDKLGRVSTVGEMTSLFTLLTFEEIRAFLSGFAQRESPSDEAKSQIYRASHSLVKVLYGLNLSMDQYEQIWKDLFSGATDGGGSPSPAPTANSHHSTATPPTFTIVDPAVTAVVPLGLPQLAMYQQRHNNTDAVHKVRISTGPGGVPASSTLFQVTFGGGAYTKGGFAYQPAVTFGNIGVNYAAMYAVTVLPASYLVRNATFLQANTDYDVSFTVTEG